MSGAGVNDVEQLLIGAEGNSVRAAEVIGDDGCLSRAWIESIRRPAVAASCIPPCVCSCLVISWLVVLTRLIRLLRSARSAAGAAKSLHENGCHDNGTNRRPLPVGRYIEQVQPIANEHHDEDAKQHADYGTSPPEQARAADHHGRDGIEFEPLSADRVNRQNFGGGKIAAMALMTPDRA
jgi:hypothetical protein